MQRKNAKLFLRLVSFGLTLFAFYFAFSYSRDLVAEADFTGLKNHLVLLVAAFVCFGFFYGILSIHWLLACRIVRPETNNQQAATFFASQPYKYLPTSLFTFSFRAKFARDLGLPIKQSSYAQVIENFDILASGAFVGVTFYVLSESITSGVLLLMSASLILTALYLRKVSAKIPIIKKTLPLHQMVKLFLVMCTAWVVGGIAFQLVNASLGISQNIYISIAANAASYVISILAFFAPGGIGVREFVLNTFGIQNAPIVVWRLVTFTADMIFGLAGLVYVRLRSAK